MAEELILQQGDKAEQYQSIIPQIKAIVEGEPDLIANLANICAALNQQFGWLWVGFYLVKQNELVLGPFSRTNCLYSYSERSWCMWYSMATTTSYYRS